MKLSSLSLLSCLLPLLATGAHVELSSKYPFQKVLFDDQGQFYGLYWNYSVAAGTIHFAVNVSTTGWVGFGVSPNGQMPGSDVVIGWVAADGKSYLHDRYAERRALPPIDVSQDWYLSFGEEEDGYTILEFSRNLTTCDPKDLDVDIGTTRTIWSFSNDDPSDPLGETAVAHNYQGSVSINLLGGLASPPSEPADLQSFDLAISNITIPSDSTTYWCQSFELPEDIRLATKYVTRVSPVIAPHVHAFVHHMLVYLCSSPLNDTLIGETGPCHAVSNDVSACRGSSQGVLIAAWAVGGEDFVYPDNVALPLGGDGEAQHAVIEMHYDNPDMLEGVIDSSGIRFYYTSSPREHDAGIMFLGHSVISLMVVPPGAPNYMIGGICTANCTESYLPDGGIQIFASALHTHLAGRALEIQHLRWNSECNVYEELPPIDLNQNYDFNFQDFSHLPKEVTVLPGDILILKCYYNATNRTSVTTGGESTLEEMCLAFPQFYPRPSGRRNLDLCVSFPIFQQLPSGEFINSFGPFFEKYFPLNPEAARLIGEGRFRDGFNAIDWTTDAVQDLQTTIVTGPTGAFCSSSTPEDSGMFDLVNDGLPQVSCPYQAPDQCNCFEPQSCCERLAAGDNAVKPTGCPTTGTSGGVAVVPHGVNVIVATLVMLWSIVLN